MGVGVAYRQAAAGALLGAGKSALIPDVLYLGLVDATGAEPVGMARVPVSALGDMWSVAGDGVATTVVIDAGLAGAGWPELTGWVLWDATTGGNPVLSGDLTPVTPDEGDPLTVPVGGLAVGVA